MRKFHSSSQAKASFSFDNTQHTPKTIRRRVQASLNAKKRFFVFFCGRFPFKEKEKKTKKKTISEWLWERYFFRSSSNGEIFFFLSLFSAVSMTRTRRKLYLGTFGGTSFGEIVFLDFSSSCASRPAQPRRSTLLVVGAAFILAWDKRRRFTINIESPKNVNLSFPIVEWKIVL